jgi:hypothetical protein
MPDITQEAPMPRVTDPRRVVAPRDQEPRRACDPWLLGAVVALVASLFLWALIGLVMVGGWR